jgi:GNAT superfamily N-acetyltransferase
VTIEQIDPTKRREINQFLTFPLKLYRKSPYWVCPILADQRKFLQPDSPFFEHADGVQFVMRHQGEIVGRIGAVVNHRYNEVQHEKTGFFGFWECIDDQEVANQLFDAGAGYLRRQGMDIMRGPASYSTNEECGLLVDGFDSSPMVMMPYNPPYYAKLMEDYGFHKVMDIYAYSIHKEAAPERIERGAKLIEKRLSLTIRPFKKREFWEEAKRILEVYNSAWSKNWCAVPWTEREFMHLAKDMKTVADLDLAFIAEDGGKPVGFSLGLPDVNQALKHIRGRLHPWAIIKLLYYSRKIRSIRIPMMGVIKEYRNRGIDTVFYHQTIQTGIRKGYATAEMSWILENNVEMNRVMEKMGATRYKTYRFYDCPLVSKPLTEYRDAKGN